MFTVTVLPTEWQATATAGGLLPSQQGPMTSAGYHWVGLCSKPLRWQWLGGYWVTSPEGVACLWKIMIQCMYDAHTCTANINTNVCILMGEAGRMTMNCSG